MAKKSEPVAEDTPPEDPAVTEALAATTAGETLDEQYDAIVQAGEDLAAEGNTEAPTGDVDEDDVVDPEAWLTEQRETWIANNPDATVIPPSLLPRDFRDGTIITPGLP